MNIAVIIPAYNEEKSIGKVINEIPNDLINEIVVVNNNSNDLTAGVAASKGATVLFESFQGYGAACLKGIEYLRNKEVEIIVFIDGDYSDYPSEMNKVIEPIINDNYDMVIGSRVLGKKEKGALTIQSRFGSIIAGLLIKLFWGVKYTDLGPFRAIKKEKLLELNMTDIWYGWTVEMQIRAAKKSFKIKEVPVSYRKRIGKSKVTGTIKGTILASIIILKTIFSELFKK
ncbi:MAG: UDP-glucose--dolichyl-phosphate glucosyltransferase [Ignavibacteriales bacterium CG12_big_fil_rev_8_21_14_0_65_30_8]|nr:MAG: UDP-glucose--dolichyl-phosphate glucosyltransferase [Ignavibacteriales bacterium CG12_big_fil_rev_8_21_14_0_65_30_8]